MESLNNKELMEEFAAEELCMDQMDELEFCNDVQEMRMAAPQMAMMKADYDEADNLMDLMASDKVKEEAK